MRAGRRDEKISIQQPIESPNQYGETEIKWLDVAEPMANISPEKGKEFFSASQINNVNPMLVTINYRKNMSDKYRIIYDGRVFEIKNCTHYRKRNETKLMCSETT